MIKKTQLTEQDLLDRLKSGEHNFVERKPKADPQEIKKAVVAFANTVRNPNEGVLFIGVEDKTGKPTGELGDMDSARRKTRKAIDSCYPPIDTYMRTFKVDGKDVIAVVVPESLKAPHFVGKAFVRVGDTSKEASDEQLQVLVEDRLSQARELRKWIDKQVTIYREDQGTANRLGGINKEHGVLKEVTAHWITWEELKTNILRSVPLDGVRLFNDKKHRRLGLIVPLLMDP